MKNLNFTKTAKQKGFTFVEVLIVMLLIGILGGSGIQYTIGTQEDKAKLTNARVFVSRTIPDAIYYCLLRQEIGSCNKSQLVSQGLRSDTQWDNDWTVSTSSSPSETLTLCYPLDGAGNSARDELGNSITNYLNGQSSLSSNQTTYTFIAGTTLGVFTSCSTKDFAIRYFIRD